MDAIAHKTKTLEKEEMQQVRSMLSDLGKTINDERIIAVEKRLGFNKTSNVNEIRLNLLNKYREGDYNYVYSQSLPYIIDNPRDFDVVDIYVKAAVRQKEKKIKTGTINKNSFLCHIINCLFSYLSKDASSEVSLGRLKVMANQMSSFKTGNCLSEKIKYYDHSDYTLEKYSLNVGYDDYSEEEKCSDDYHSIIQDDITPIFVKQKVVSHWFKQFVTERRDFDAILLYLEAYNNNPLNIALVDTQKIIKRQDELLLYLDQPALETSVFYALSGAPHHMIYHFFKKYLKKQGSQKIPSEIIDENRKGFTPLIEIFFNKVCSSESIKNYIKKFPNSDSALRERLNILTKLSKMHRNEEYLDEMTVIRRKLNAKQRVQNLDQRMIYVDETALKDTEFDEVKKQFGIYKETESTLETKKFLIEADKIESAEMLDMGKMKIKTERVKYKNFLFRQMFMEIRRQFLISYKFGLWT